MNERTEALAKQAAEYAIEFAAKDQELYIPRLMEKFAELIVKECADVAWMNTPETEELEYSHLISNKIKQHFGVEE